MSEYDLEELNATRKINGVDDGLYTETIEVLQKELERKNKELDNYLETHKDYLSDEAEAIRKDIHRLINKIALLEKSATKKEENVANMTEEAFNEIIDNFEVVAYLTKYGRKGIKDNVKKLQARIKELEEENSNLKRYIKEIIKEKQELTTNLLNSISIQKINDQIEKYEHMLALTALGEIQKQTPGEILLIIDTLKELLEEK